MAIVRRPIYFCGCICALVACSNAADLPDANPFAGKPISAVRFEPPQQPLTADQLSSIVGFKINAPLYSDELRAAIKRLYSTGRYSDVAVEGEPSAGGIALIFRTQDQWFIGPVQVRGKVTLPPNVGQLANATKLELGQPYQEDSLSAATQGIEQLLNREGFYKASIEPKIDQDPDHQQILLTFLVNAGKRARLTTPLITGDRACPPKKSPPRQSTRAGSAGIWIPTATFKAVSTIFAKNSPARIVSRLQRP